MNKRLRAAERYAALMRAYWEGTQEGLPGPMPVDPQLVRLYDETWQDRWERLTGRRPNATDEQG